DRQLRFIYVNPAMEQATGIPPQSFLGKTLTAIDLPSAYQLWQVKLQWVLSTGQPQTDEFSFPAPDGVLHFYQTRLVPEFDASGTTASILTVTRDITYLKQTEAALRHSEELSRTVLENFPNGGVFLFDRHLHYVLAEGMGLAKVGLTKAALENKTLWQTLPPENHPMIELAYHNTLAGQTSRFETAYGGHVYDVDVLPLKNDRNEVMMGMAIIQDITERKQIEVALSQANDRFRLAAAAVNCMIYDWDSQQGMVLRTEGLLRILGYAPAEVEPTQEWWWQQIHPADQETLPPSIAATSLVDNRYTLEYRVRHKQGHYVYVLDQGLVLRDEAGNPIRVVGSTTDISDRKQNEAERTELLAREQAARQQAEAASRMKDEFLAVVSHELRSPLNAILGWSRLLRTRRLDADKVEQALESIERNAQAQTQLIEDLLDISRIIRGKIRLSPCPTHLVPVIQAALD
ncbi:MAG TPA: PAS domain S-box protein, partial [Allocoleopsis sp.]